jgi:uncharacterized protein
MAKPRPGRLAERRRHHLRTIREMQVRRSRSALTRLPVIWLLVSLAFAFSAVSIFAERVEDLPKPVDYISDFAHVLSPQTIARLDRLCGQLDHSKTNAQVAIVTIKTLDGDDVSDFANRLEERWKVGKKGSDRGILMLLSIQDHKRWIEVGYGLEGILPDARVGDIGRLMVPDLRQGNYDGAVTTGLVQIANVIAADAGVSFQERPQQNLSPRHQPSHGTSLISILFRIFLILLVLGFLGARGLFGFGLGWFMGGGGRGGGGWGGGGGGDGGGSSGGGSGFGGFGGGESGGGGAGGDW